MTSVLVEQYSEKAIVVRNTLEHHGAMLTSLGGTFNDRLKGGRGWIFPKHMLTQVRNMIEKLNSGQYGNEYEQKVSSPNVVDMVSKSDYLSLLSRVEQLEALVLKKTPSTYVSTVVKEEEIKEKKVLSKPVKERSPPKHDDTPDWVDEFEQEATEKKRLVPVKSSK